jgi:hypothetical protein
MLRFSAFADIFKERSDYENPSVVAWRATEQTNLRGAAPVDAANRAPIKGSFFRESKSAKRSSVDAANRVKENACEAFFFNKNKGLPP